ncbi:protein kinase, putative [Phytophthora infestans T30-4]|uniref:Protein kinase, putative n=1 Tax=Phytophthora infestans (strain T30-4) TaxID=403677 RepID=D0N3C7_PHYIT|nr:protein kinase, putative [Phytophthora infestans T30-4]EEY69419.1 protein kinase, putative [Phytophthora infestans T30-4]|eukprot:XP_002999273.1 protein kinase, putative [Phytophthora infestans T30-4]
MEVPHTFVRTVKAQDLRFSQVDSVLHDIKTKNSPTWVIFSFADQREMRNTLKVLASGDGSISDQSKWPSELFSPNALCYGLTSIDCYDENAAPTNVLSFCWKGRNLPIYLRTKYAEFNQVIRKHMGAVAHVTLHNPEELMDGSVFLQTPRRRPRSSSRRFVTTDIEFTPELTATVLDIRSDTSPFNWAVCGYDNSDIESSTRRMIVVEKGMTGLYALKGIGGITSVLEEGSTMYIYLRVDVPLHRGTERIVSKYVLVTWQGVERSYSGGGTSDDEVELWFGPSSNGERSPQRRDSFASSSKLQRAVTAHVHGSEIYRVFPHHVHFFASTQSEISEEAIRERIRRAVDNDCMLLRVVCVQASGDTQAPVCLEVPFDATVGVLRQEIASNIGIPKDRQRIVWIRQTDDLAKDSQLSTALMLEDENAGIRKDIGLAHGDKIHVDDKDNGENSVLAKLFEQINSGAAAVSLSAERRHEVQRGVEAREAELRKILSMTHYLIRRKANEDLKPIPRLAGVVEEAVTREKKQTDSPSPTSQHKVIHRADSAVSLTGSISEELAKEDVSALQEHARVLESQNQYLEIPYESIHILSGKENELGCGKAATVFRGLWMNRNSAAEVAVKSFRYARLTDKILGDYRQEVALLRKLKHPNIVLFIGACTDPKLMILTEYCSRKSLFEVIHSNNFETIPWKFKVRMMLDAARGIQYLHSKRIIHRDIKSHNFLVDDDWRVKVADFGISKVLDTDTAFTQCVLLDEDLGYTFKADNWSFAIVMWEMVAGGLQNPFIGMAPIKFYNKTINAGIRPPIPEGMDSEYINLITECWKSDAADRPSFDVIVSRLEQMLLDLGASIDLPPTFQGGYHQAGLAVNP